jgi:hypothetical protein
MNDTEIHYWKNFYSSNKIILEPSDFAIFISNYFKDKNIKK